jgi:hypothetical protein
MLENHFADSSPKIIVQLCSREIFDVTPATLHGLLPHKLVVHQLIRIRRNSQIAAKGAVQG